MTTAQKTIWRNTRKKKAIELLGGECIECGSTDKLHFDHVDNDRTDEKYKISNLINYKWETIIKELQKCQLLCASCHSKKTAVDNGHSGELRHGTYYGYCKFACRCNDCRQAALTYEQSRKDIRNKRDRDRRSFYKLTVQGI